MNDRIVHRDLISLGIIFLSLPEEREFLKRVNDEFAYLVGLEALDLIRGNDDESGDVAFEDIWKFLEKNQEKCSEIIETVRARILLNLEERRKHLIGGSSTERISFAQGTTSNNTPQQKYCPLAGGRNSTDVPTGD